jgi:hypothetical protein
MSTLVAAALLHSLMSLSSITRNGSKAFNSLTLHCPARGSSMYTPGSQQWWPFQFHYMYSSLTLLTFRNTENSAAAPASNGVHTPYNVRTSRCRCCPPPCWPAGLRTRTRGPCARPANRASTAWSSCHSLQSTTAAAATAWTSPAIRSPEWATPSSGTSPWACPSPSPSAASAAPTPSPPTPPRSPSSTVEILVTLRVLDRRIRRALTTY